MTNGVNKLYEFAEFRLDAESGTLWRADEIVSLSPKALELLTLLVERRGQVISKQEIFDNVWRETFVEDGVLTQNIYTLRNALGPDKFIETVPRRGYRFTAPVEVLVEETPNGNGHMEEEQVFISRPADRAVDSKPAQHRSFARVAVFAGIGALILSAIGVGAYRYVFSGGDNKAAFFAPIEQLRFQRLTDTGDIIHPTISPNGELLAYVRVEDDGESVWVKQVATGSTVRMLPPSSNGYRSLAFSPDGKYLFFRELADPGAIIQTTPYGGMQRKVGENAWSDFSVSPDGKRLAFLRRDTARNVSLMIVSNLDGTGERELATRPGGGGFRGGAPAWSPDGERIVIAISSQKEPRPVLASVDTETGELNELPTPDWREISRCQWLPTGKQIVVAARSREEPTSQLWMMDFPDGKVRRLTNDLEAYFWTSVSADGKVFVTRQQRIFAHLWHFENGDPKMAKQLTFGERNLDGQAGMTMTPDGKVIHTAFDGKTTDLFSTTVDGERTQLTANAGHDNTWPSVSPDGRRVAFTSARTKSRQVWIMDADGTNQRQLSFGEEPRQSGAYPNWSPDGREIFFIRSGSGPPSIWKTSIDGGEPVQVSKLKDAAVEAFLSISPDGKWIAFRHVSTTVENVGEERAIVIGVIASDGSGEPKLFSLPLRRPMVRWAPDSKSFYYAAGTFNASSFWRQPIEGGKAEKLFDLPDRIFNFAFSIDGDLIVSRGKLVGDAILVTNFQGS